MDGLLQPISDAMRELTETTSIVLCLRARRRRTARRYSTSRPWLSASRTAPNVFDHLVIETSPLWQAELYACIKNLAVTLDPSSYTNGYRVTLDLVSLSEEVSGPSQRAITRELHCANNEAVGSALPPDPNAMADDDDAQEARAAAAGLSRASSASDRIHTVFEYLERQWYRWKRDATSAASATRPPLINRKLCTT
jgi:hypothetical protein